MAIIRGQRYDGFCSISGNVVGAEVIIQKNSPKALYVHFSSHFLNLVIAKSCKVTAIRNMLDKLTEVCLFFRDSPKRNKPRERTSNSLYPRHKQKKSYFRSV